MARSTRASAAVERLRTRSGNHRYAMVCVPGDRFYLSLMVSGAAPEILCEPMDQEAFVKFVNAFGPQQPRKASKLDVQFERQLVRKV